MGTEVPDTPKSCIKWADLGIDRKQNGFLVSCPMTLGLSSSFRG